MASTSDHENWLNSNAANKSLRPITGKKLTRRQDPEYYVVSIQGDTAPELVTGPFATVNQAKLAAHACRPLDPERQWSIVGAERLWSIFDIPAACRPPIEPWSCKLENFRFVPQPEPLPDDELPDWLAQSES